MSGMETHCSNLYTDADRYDLVLGRFASGDQLEFYRRQIERYGDPVLELACGSGRIAIPLAEKGVRIIGLDLSKDMLKAARVKIAERGVTVPLVQADMRNFDLGQTFKIIFIAAQSLSHLYTREDVEACFAAVQRHLAPGGRFIIELFNPSVKLLAREPGVRYTLPKSEYDDPNGKGKVIQTEEVDYDSATQVMQINWFFRYEGSNEEPVLSFEMRQFFPQEIDALLNYNGFEIEHKFGDFEERPFGNGSPKQLIVCKPR